MLAGGFTLYIMNNNIKNLLETAYNELGYFEKASNDKLDDKTENAGDLNYTKYARDCFPELQGLAWCCMFTWWCFEKTFGKIMARNLIGEKTAKCSTMKQRMIDIGCKMVTRPMQGDIIFFDSGTGINHVGIVYSVGDNTFSTIEGNTKKGIEQVIANGGGVCVRAYSYTNPKINSYVRPLWNLIKDSYNDPSPIEKYNAEVAANNVNVRSGPGTEYKVMGMVSRPYQLNVLATVTDGSGRPWYKFVYNGKIAYICAKYVRLL